MTTVSNSKKLRAIPPKSVCWCFCCLEMPTCFDTQSGVKSPLHCVREISECIYGGFPRSRATFLEVPIIRTVIFLGVYWGRPA